MHVSASNVLLCMILYDENCITSIYLMGLFLGIFVLCTNRNKYGILFMVVSGSMS